jgi:hypothetical protein
MPVTPPAATTRTAPTGKRQKDGFKTTVAFAGAPGFTMWEKSLTPPAIDGGGAISLADMFATTWRVKAAKSLKEMGDISGSAHYNPATYTDAMAQTNVEQAITILFPSGHQLSFYGFLDKFTPGENAEGNESTCSFTIVVTNRDPLTDLEAGPVLTAPPP